MPDIHRGRSRSTSLIVTAHSTSVAPPSTASPVDASSISGNLGNDTTFEMFRRAKLMLNRIDSTTIDTALDTGSLVAHIDLTGDDGGPRCARVEPPAISWSTSTP